MAEINGNDAIAAAAEAGDTAPTEAGAAGADAAAGELTNENLEEVAGGDLVETLLGQYTAFKHGLVDGYNGV